MSQASPSNDTLSKVPSAETKAAEAKDEKQVEALLEQVPPNLIRETLIAVLREGASPRIDPENFKVAARTVEQEQNNKLTFLMRKLEVEDEESKRTHDLALLSHKDKFKILRPAVYTVLAIFPVCLFIGIYLAVIGHAVLGSSLITGVVTSFLSYLAGGGTKSLYTKDTKD
jgi:hypothetical protein